MIIFGPITKKCFELFSQFCTESNGQIVVKHESVGPLLKFFNIYLTSSQQRSVFYFINAVSGRPPDSHIKQITFGQFCAIVSEYEEYCGSKTQGGSLPANGTQAKSLRLNRSRTFCAPDSHIGYHEVFLGGACNPTKWRKDTAIPFLKNHKLTYFNPQLDNWTPERVALEDSAKREAVLLLFVLDCCSRCIASMVEISYLSGCTSPLVVAITGQFLKGQTIVSEVLSDNEVEDLNRGINFVTDFVEREGLPVYNTVGSALAACEYILGNNLTPKDLVCETHTPRIRFGEYLQRLKRCFGEIDVDNVSYLSVSDVFLALKLATGHECGDEFRVSLTHYLASRQITRVDFDSFCCIAADYQNEVFPKIQLSVMQRLISSLANFFQTERSQLTTIRNHESIDVYLGGSCGDATWRISHAVPFFLQHGITYYNPQLPTWNMTFLGTEDRAKDQCLILLYVISSATRSVASMVEAAYYIGKGRRVVLCVEPLQDANITTIDQMTPTAIKDYRRGRTYLTDLANRNRIPVFPSVHGALHLISEQLKGTWV